MDTMKINILVGRFQPITKGHIKCAEVAYKETGHPTVLCMVETKTPDERHPFLSRNLVPIYKDLFKGHPWFEDIVLVRNADIVSISELLKGYEINSWTCGTDRYDSYSKMAAKYSEKAGLTPEFRVIEIPRTPEDVSATKLREALKNNDKKAFMAGFPKIGLRQSLRMDLYETLREWILAISK